MSTLPKFKIKTDGITYEKLWAIRRVLQPEKYIWRAVPNDHRDRLYRGWLLFGHPSRVPAYCVGTLDATERDYQEVPQDKVLEVFFGTDA